MQPLRNLRDALRRALAPSAPPAVEPEAGSDEFADLLDSVGAEPVAEEDSALALRDATISALQEQLNQLRDLGDRLATTERARLSAEAELERVRTEARLGSEEELRAELVRLRRKLARRDARCRRLTERVAALRERVDERHRTAADRWHELRRERSERKELMSALDRERRRIADLQGPVLELLDAEPARTPAVRARLIELMGFDEAR